MLQKSNIFNYFVYIHLTTNLFRNNQVIQFKIFFLRSLLPLSLFPQKLEPTHPLTPIEFLKDSMTDYGRLLQLPGDLLFQKLFYRRCRIFFIF